MASMTISDGSINAENPGVSFRKLAPCVAGEAVRIRRAQADTQALEGEAHRGIPRSGMDRSEATCPAGGEPWGGEIKSHRPAGAPDCPVA